MADLTWKRVLLGLVGCVAASAWLTGWIWGSTWVYMQGLGTDRDGFILSYSLGLLTAVLVSTTVWIAYERARERRATPTIRQR